MKRLRFAALGPILLILAACKPVVLSPSGDVASRQADVLVISTLLMLLIIVPVMGLTVYFAWKYRASNKDAEYDPEWDHSTKLELIVWAAPLLIIICLSALTWVGTHLLDPYRPLDRIAAGRPVEENTKPLVVQVVSLDWKWLFIYPEQGVATVNEVAVPIDRPVKFEITSDTVMNAFYVPAMAGMIYSMAGMETTLYGVMNEPGEFDGFSANYSGWGFSGMRFKLHSLDDAGFDQWVTTVKSSPDAMTRQAYLDLSHPTMNEPPAHYGSVDDNLFDLAVNMCVEPGKMCMNEMASIDARGGAGMAGVYNVATLDAGNGRRGQAITASGALPFKVTSFCTPADSLRMFGNRDVAALQPADATPMRGHGMKPPAGFFSVSPNVGFTQLAPATVTDADRNL